MLIDRRIGTRPLIGMALSFLLLALALWGVPSEADASNGEDQAFSVSISVPLNPIQEGQYCVAYAVLSGGTAPYEYEWSGSYFWGDTHVVDAYMWGQDGYVELEVTDANTNSDGALEWLQVKPTHSYNPACEA